LVGVAVDVLLEVKGATRLRLLSTGLLLFVRARFSGSDPELSGSSLMARGDAIPFAFEMDLVMGPKYPSFEPTSEGVGEGDITRGVRGIWYCEAMADSQESASEGSEGACMRPQMLRLLLEKVPDSRYPRLPIPSEYSAVSRDQARVEIPGGCAVEVKGPVEGEPSV